MLISAEYIEHNKALHAANEDYGTSGNDWIAYVEHLMLDEGHKTVLDYGCGKGNLAAGLKSLGIACAEYDPAVQGKDATPEPADLLCVTDVLEHIEPESLDAVLADISRLAKRRVLFDICTVPALKTLPDGRNAHLIVEPWEWWQDKLSKYFTVTHHGFATEVSVYGEAIPLGAPPIELPKRVRMTPEVSAMFDRIRYATHMHADALSRVESIRLYDGVHDRRADLVVAMDCFDEAEDPNLIFDRVIKACRKSALFRVPVTETRTKEYWLEALEKKLRIASQYGNDKMLVVVGTPRVGVYGVKVVGATPSDDRWEQVKAACQRISKRASPAPAHDRTAVLACYGPSLRQTVPLLETMAKTGDVFSVSGAHDYLLEHGIAPKFHVECDPRPHKADNIDISHPNVRYLIGSGVSPILLDKLEGADVALWHIATPEHVMRFMTELKESGKIVISGGGSVGLRAISLAYNMGYRKFEIFGMDCSFADDGEHQWAGRHAGKRQQVVKANCGDRAFATSLVLLTYATDFIEMAQKVSDCELNLYGDGLLQEMCLQHAKMAEAA